MADPAKKRKWIPLSTETTAPAVDADYARFSFPGLFNERHLSDLVVHTSKDENAPRFYCHKFVLKCASDMLYDKLMQNKIESTSDPKREHVLIVPELQGKEDSLIKTFFGVIYDESLAFNKTLTAQLDFVADVLMTYDMPGLRNAIADGTQLFRNVYSFSVDKYAPKLNAETPLSDFTWYLDSTKKNYIKTHRAMLSSYSLFFGGLFESGMKDRDAHESILNVDFKVEQAQLNQSIEKLFDLLYSKQKVNLSAMKPSLDDLLVLSRITSQYLFTNMRALITEHIFNHVGIDYVVPAIKYENREVLDEATKYFIHGIAFIDLKLFPVSYLNELRFDNGRNLFHGIVTNAPLSGVTQIESLEKLLEGDKSAITLLTADNDGNTCFHLACAQTLTHSQLIEYMITRKMDVNAKNKAGDTPFKIALRAYAETILSRYESGRKERKDNKLRLWEKGLPEDDKKRKKNKEKKEKPARYSIIDKLILAKASLDLTSDQDLKALLCYACEFPIEGDATVWTAITTALGQHAPDRLSALVDRAHVLMALQSAHLCPLKYLFNTLKLPFKVTAHRSDKQKDVELTVVSMTEIRMGTKKFNVHGMKLTQHIQERWGKDHIFRTTTSLTLHAGTKKIVFAPNGDVVTVLKALVSIENGDKNIERNITPAKLDRW